MTRDTRATRCGFGVPNAIESALAHFRYRCVRRGRQGLVRRSGAGQLAANADGDILQRYDEDLDAAFEQAREQGDVTPLGQTVKRWWFEADAWRDPQAQRQFLARIDTYRDRGPPPAEQRMSREEIRTRFGV